MRVLRAWGQEQDARRVHVVIRGADLNAGMSRYLVERLVRLGNVEFHTSSVVQSLAGDDRLQSITLARTDTSDRETIAARALFIFIGAEPHSGWLSDGVEPDRAGFVVTGPALSLASLTSEAWRQVRRAPHFLETSLPGVFAVGDVRSGSVKRVASSVGEGAMAVTFVHAHLGAVRGHVPGRDLLPLETSFMSSPRCVHLDQVHDVQPHTPDGCEECLKHGTRWVHLRHCVSRGHVGCCDSSPQQHASKHFRQSARAVMRSFEPGEDWGWCFIDQLVVEPATRPSRT